MMETWAEMRARHRREKRAAMQHLASLGLTQTEAARVLGMSLSGLNNFLIRENIPWPVIRQGPRKSRENHMSVETMHIHKPRKKWTFRQKIQQAQVQSVNTRKDIPITIPKAPWEKQEAAQ